MLGFLRFNKSPMNHSKSHEFSNQYQKSKQKKDASKAWHYLHDGYEKIRLNFEGP